MASYHQTIIVGNVGRDPELRYTQSGTAVCSFSVAVTERWGKAEDRKEKTTWYRINAWNSSFSNLAEVCNTYVHKGMQIMVVGTVEASAYTAQDGEARASLDLRAREVQFLGRRDDAPQGDGNQYDDDFASAAPANNIDDIPF